jgi:hypothetical protein
MIPESVAIEPNGMGLYKGLWDTLHLYAHNFPDNPSELEKHSASNFYRSFSGAISCVNPCRVHYHQYLETYPIENYLDSRSSLKQYVVDLHNDVNKRLGKPLLTCEQVDEERLWNSKINHTALAKFLRNSPTFRDKIGSGAVGGSSGQDQGMQGMQGPQGPSQLQTTKTGFSVNVIWIILGLFLCLCLIGILYDKHKQNQKASTCVINNTKGRPGRPPSL